MQCDRSKAAILGRRSSTPVGCSIVQNGPDAAPEAPPEADEPYPDRQPPKPTPVAQVLRQGSASPARSVLICCSKFRQKPQPRSSGAPLVGPKRANCSLVLVVANALDGRQPPLGLHLPPPCGRHRAPLLSVHHQLVRQICGRLVVTRLIQVACTGTRCVCPEPREFVLKSSRGPKIGNKREIAHRA